MQRSVCHLIDANVETAYFSSIARCHDRSQFPVMIGSIAPAGSLQESMSALGIPTFSLDVRSRWQYPLAAVRLARLLRRQQINLLHSHCFDPTLVGLSAARLARIPFIFTRHHSDHHIRLGKAWHTRIDSWCARHADHVIAVSQVTRRIMIEVESVPERQITVVHNGMEPLREPTAEGVDRVRRELNLGSEHVCLMIARLHEEKGHRFLFEAAPEIIAKAGPTIFLLAGDGPHREELEAMVKASGLSSVVRFLGRRSDVPELIALSTLIVLPSLAESFGFAPLEAMSLAKPVVAAATGGIPEVVSDGETGLLVPSADAAALSEAVVEILLNPTTARTLGEHGLLRTEIFKFDRMMRGYEDVYRRFSPHLSGQETVYAEHSAGAERR